MAGSNRDDASITADKATSEGGWYNFIHGRVGSGGCRLAGFLRIGFGLIFLADRWILGLDLDEYFSPSHGILPMQVGRQSDAIVPQYMRSLLELAPESDVWMWTLYYVGLLQGMLLVLGVLPRFQLACLFVNILSFQHHNAMFWNHQDILFRLWCFFLLFMPLHKITIFDWLVDRRAHADAKRTAEDTWPVWPFRLFQLNLAIMYMGLSLTKLESSEWRSGDALYWIKESNEFVGGWIDFPDLTLPPGHNGMLGWQLLTWLTLGLELSCWVTMWVPNLRKPTAFGMIVFNVLMDLTLNLHCLPWLTILGWSATLFEEEKCQTSKQKQLPAHCTTSSLVPSSNSLELRVVTNVFLVVLMSFLMIDALPVASMERLLYAVVPSATADETPLAAQQQELYNAIEPALCLFGLWQEVWNLYGKVEGGEGLADHYRIHFEAILQRDSGIGGKIAPAAEVWQSPRPEHMATGWERKRYGRQMVYWQHMTDRSVTSAWLALGAHLASESNRPFHQRGTVVGLELQAYWEGVNDVPYKEEDGEYYYIDNVLSSWTSVMKIRYCTDVVPVGSFFSGRNDICQDCVSQPSHVARHCRAKCELCVNHYVEFGQDYLSAAMSEYVDETGDYCDGFDTDEDGWTEEEIEDCLYYTYYRDFDTAVPRDEKKLQEVRDRYFGLGAEGEEQEVGLTKQKKSQKRSTPSKSNQQQQKSSTSKQQGRANEQANQHQSNGESGDPHNSGNQTASLESVPRRTVLKSA